MQLLAPRFQRLALRLDMLSDGLAQLLRLELVGVAQSFVERGVSIGEQNLQLRASLRTGARCLPGTARNL